MSRLLLIGCGRTKAPHPARAEELYTGSLFRARRAYAKRSGSPWWIISAKHGLVSPDTVLHPYELRITDLAEVDRAAWYLRTVATLLDELADGTRLREVYVEIHAGAAYAKTLTDLLLAVGISNWCPLEGLGIGEQLAWYRRETARAARAVKHAR